jgi:hypothetical protein
MSCHQLFLCQYISEISKQKKFVSNFLAHKSLSTDMNPDNSIFPGPRLRVLIEYIRSVKQSSGRFLYYYISNL